MLMRGETLTMRILYLLDIKKEAFALSCNNFLPISHFCDLCSQTYKHRNLKQAFLDKDSKLTLLVQKIVLCQWLIDYENNYFR